MKIFEQNPLCYIRTLEQTQRNRLVGLNEFQRHCVPFWENKLPKNEIQYYSHLIIDGDNKRRYCPDVDYFVFKDLD